MQFPVCIPSLVEKRWSAAPVYHLHGEMATAAIGLRAKAILLPKWLTGPHMATHPQNVFLESYFAKPNLKEGTAHVSKLQVKMFLLGFNLTFFCPNPNPTLLNMSQISPGTQAPLVADPPLFLNSKSKTP